MAAGLKDPSIPLLSSNMLTSIATCEDSTGAHFTGIDTLSSWKELLISFRVVARQLQLASARWLRGALLAAVDHHGMQCVDVAARLSMISSTTSAELSQQALPWIESTVVGEIL